jgi:hypothetical protein
MAYEDSVKRGERDAETFQAELQVFKTAGKEIERLADERQRTKGGEWIDCYHEILSERPDLKSRYLSESFGQAPRSEENGPR